MSNPTSNKIYLLLIVAVLIAGAWVLGKRQGASGADALAAIEPSSVEAQIIIEQLQDNLEQAELELAQTLSDMEINTKRTDTLQDLLDEQMQGNVSDAVDLALYRRIEKSEKSRAIEIESLRWSALLPSTLKVTLIHWQGRERVTGSLQLSLIYRENMSSEASIDGQNDTLSEESKVDLDPVSFDFRFFQTLSISILENLTPTGSGNSELPVPHNVDVKIIPNEKGYKTTKIEFLWSDVAE